MAAPTFSTAAQYKPKSGDFICLAWAGSKKLFADLQIPVSSGKIKKGKSKTLFSGAFKTAKNLIVRGYGLDPKDISQECKNLVAKALKTAESEDAKRLVVFANSKTGIDSIAIQEGAILGGYVYDAYLKTKAKPLPVMLITGKGTGLQNNRIILKAVNFARDILNGPPNDIKPPKLASIMNKEGRAAGLKITVWDDKRLVKEKCGGVIAVGQGSQAKPRMVIAEYKPAKAEKHICLVGKGVTFDSGGYCLKPSASQIGMKYDMGGAAMMFGAACAIARLKLPIKVTCITPLVENAVSGNAYLTTTVLKTRGGKTVEVHNTDAEGRLILADALGLAGEKKPDYIIDSATLTGACVVALGEDITAVYGTDKKFTAALLKAGETAGEHLWEMPLHQPYAEQLKTTIADCKNLGGRWGGSITAALFLQKFVPENVPWIHCDIAGPGCKEEPLDHLGKGSKGFGVKTIVELARTLSNKK